MFDYKQRSLTKEYEEGYDRIFGKQSKKKKKISLQEARELSLKIQKKAEKERAACIMNETLVQPCENKTAVCPISNKDLEEINRLNKEGTPVFWE